MATVADLDLETSPPKKSPILPTQLGSEPTPALKSDVGTKESTGKLANGGHKQRYCKIGVSHERGKHTTTMDGSLSDEYSQFGKSDESLDSLRAHYMKAMPGNMLSLDEILDQIYLHQYHPGMSESSLVEHHGNNVLSTTTMAALQAHHDHLAPFGTQEAMIRSSFYGAFISAIILLSIFVVGMAVVLPMLFSKLADIQERVDQIKISRRMMPR